MVEYVRAHEVLLTKYEDARGNPHGVSPWLHMVVTMHVRLVTEQ